MTDLFDEARPHLKFWIENAWNYGVSDSRKPAATSTFASSLEEQIENAYNNSAEFRRLYDGTVTAAGKVRIGGSPPDYPNFARAMTDSPDKWIALHPPSLENLRWVNTNGEVVGYDLIIILAHELHHMFNANTDPLIPTVDDFRSPTDSEQNAVGWNFSGGANDSQNLVAVELGMAEKQRVSYGAVSDGTAGAPPLTVGQEFTGSVTIDIARLGTDGTNIQDHRLKGSTRDLIVGLGGVDDIYGGGGNDFLFGREGDDQILGGAGNDTLVGGSGIDTLQGGADDDVLRGGDNGDLIETGQNSENGYDEVHGDDGGDVIVLDGTAAEIDGGAGADRLYFQSTDPNVSSLVTSGSTADRIYWNGYALSGGPKSIIDAEYQDGMPYADIGCYDAHGVRYYLYDYAPNELSIIFPSGGGIAITGFEEGHYGISVGAPVAQATDATMGGSAEQGWTLETDLPLSPICFDETFGNYEDLPGAAAALATSGPNQPSLPTS